jgi:DNA replication and repair protein RecF
MIADIRLQHFRSYADAGFEFSPEVNIIVGPNASGKTNLLEALLVLARGSSYRAADAELLSHHQPWARLDANTPDGKRVLKLEHHGPVGITKNFVIAERPFKRLPRGKLLPVVLFEPDHLRLLSGSPELRREFIDTLLENLQPGYGTLRRQYKRSLLQRNRLLKQPMLPTEQLFVWNIRLSELGGQIVAQRLQLLDQLNARLPEVYSQLAKQESQVVLEYRSQSATNQYATQLLHRLEANQHIDQQRGFTTNGPHRDDIQLLLNSHAATTAASRGESRSLLLSLKVLELQLIEAAYNQKPLLLLDDVFSELDGARRRALTEVIAGYQSFITTTDADIVVQHFMDRASVIPL